METHVFQVNTFLRFYLVCAKWIFQLISASWGTDVFQVCSFGAAKQIVGSHTAKMCDGEKKSGKDSINAKWILVSIPCFWSCYHRCTNTGFSSSSVFEFSFTWLCEKCMCLPSFVKKFAKLTNKLPVYWNVTFMGVEKAACLFYTLWFGILEIISCFTFQLYSRVTVVFLGRQFGQNVGWAEFITINWNCYLLNTGTWRQHNFFTSYFPPISLVQTEISTSIRIQRLCSSGCVRTFWLISFS